MLIFDFCYWKCYWRRAIGRSHSAANEQSIISLSKTPMLINAHARARKDHSRAPSCTAIPPYLTLKGTQLYSFGEGQHLSRWPGERGGLAGHIAHAQTVNTTFSPAHSTDERPPLRRSALFCGHLYAI